MKLVSSNDFWECRGCGDSWSFGNDECQRCHMPQYYSVARENPNYTILFDAIRNLAENPMPSSFVVSYCKDILSKVGKND